MHSSAVIEVQKAVMGVTVRDCTCTPAGTAASLIGYSTALARVARKDDFRAVVAEMVAVAVGELNAKRCAASAETLVAVVFAEDAEIVAVASVTMVAGR